MAEDKHGLAPSKSGRRTSGPGEALHRLRDKIPDGAREKVSELGERVVDETRARVDARMSLAADEVERVARAVDSAAECFRTEERDRYGHYLGDAAEGLRGFAGRLRETEPDEVVHEVSDFARRYPGAVFGGAVAAGFLLSRFMKASTERRRQRLGGSTEEDWSHPDERSSPPYESSYEPFVTSSYESTTSHESTTNETYAQPEGTYEREPERTYERERYEAEAAPSYEGRRT